MVSFEPSLHFFPLDVSLPIDPDLAIQMIETDCMSK